MQNRPPYTGHSGNCVVNAVANVLHWTSDGVGQLLKRGFSSKPQGHLLSEINAMLHNAYGDIIHFAPLYFSRSTPLTTEQLNKEYDFVSVAEMNPNLEEEVFFQLIAFIETDKGSQHCISMYLSLYNLALIVMDSAWPGTVELIELAQLCAKYKVIGLGMLVNETIEGYEPFFIEKTMLKIF